jgi:hypothetical protein
MFIKIARQPHARRNNHVAVAAITAHPARDGIKMGGDILCLHKYFCVNGKYNLPTLLHE